MGELSVVELSVGELSGHRLLHRASIDISVHITRHRCGAPFGKVSCGRLYYKALSVIMIEQFHIINIYIYITIEQQELGCGKSTLLMMMTLFDIIDNALYQV